MNRAHRLTSTRDFARVTRAGRRGAAGSIGVAVSPREAERAAAPVRVGVTTTRSVGGAVERNRAKRRIREAARARLDRLPAGTDVVIAAREGINAKNCQEIESDLERALARAGVRVSA